MSGSGENKWRGPGRQSSQRHSGNANRDRTGGQGGAQGGNNTWGNTSSSQEQHVSVRGFNTAEAKSILKRGPNETKPIFYKPTGKDASSQRSGGPWGAKSNTMANGKDFFVELRKQVAALQKGGPVVGG
ncbi:uncharacterized protein N7483_013114 [Penicillium malachiteum]|uniref:uncharacterized protein n=1 Tax=Penicillium malachiteum TaxID=1324776 RepID=UPI0025465B2B|nr:uncharacterized protein N7483_013114 [Penicillium malachiteum]KAJ5715933.1 hypothetical protein N7483_013114 [Penicillium malachiteum]